MNSFQSARTGLARRFPGLHRELALFVCTIAAVGFGESMYNAVFNNFLADTFSLNSFYRTFLELPRESGGVLVVFVSALLFFLPDRRVAVVAALLGATGLVLMGLFSVTFHWMFLWLFLFSLGQHLLMPLFTGISMELAREGETGKRLGQFNALRNCAVICGSFFTFIGFKYLRFNFNVTFVIAALSFVVGAVLLLGMKPGERKSSSTHLKLHRRYSLYYWLSIVYGTRKQIFLTFAPWVLVTVYKQPTASIATLLTVSGVCGIVFQPFLGRAVDRFGERFILSAEALLLIVVCMGYGFARDIFSSRVALFVACGCFVADQLLMSVNMARSTYLKKIAVQPDHVSPALSMSLSLDHIFSITIALLGGVIWARWGYQTVFVVGAGIALINFISARFIKIPAKQS